MTEGTPPTPDQPQTPGQQPPPYGQPFGQTPPPGQPPYGQPTPPPYSPAPEQPAYAQQPAYAVPQPGYGQPPAGRDPERRPGTVLGAAIVTWVFAGIAAIGSAVMLVAVNADRDTFVEEMERDEDISDLGWSGDEIATAFNVVSVVVIALAVLAVILAVVAFRRSNGGRIALVVLSGITALLSLAGSIFCLPALWLVASVVTMVLLFTGGANDWYARRVPAQPPTYNPPGDYGQWPQA